MNSKIIGDILIFLFGILFSIAYISLGGIVTHIRVRKRLDEDNIYFWFIILCNSILCLIIGIILLTIHYYSEGSMVTLITLLLIELFPVMLLITVIMFVVHKFRITFLLFEIVAVFIYIFIHLSYNQFLEMKRLHKFESHASFVILTLIFLKGQEYLFRNPNFMKYLKISAKTKIAITIFVVFFHILVLFFICHDYFVFKLNLNGLLILIYCQDFLLYLFPMTAQAMTGYILMICMRLVVFYKSSIFDTYYLMIIFYGYLWYLQCSTIWDRYKVLKIFSNLANIYPQKLKKDRFFVYLWKIVLIGIVNVVLVWFTNLFDIFGVVPVTIQQVLVLSYLTIVIGWIMHVPFVICDNFGVLTDFHEIAFRSNFKKISFFVVFFILSGWLFSSKWFAQEILGFKHFPTFALPFLFVSLVFIFLYLRYSEIHSIVKDKDKIKLPKTKTEVILQVGCIFGIFFELNFLLSDIYGCLVFSCSYILIFHTIYHRMKRTSMFFFGMMLIIQLLLPIMLIWGEFLKYWVDRNFYLVIPLYLYTNFNFFSFEDFSMKLRKFIHLLIYFVSTISRLCLIYFVYKQNPPNLLWHLLIVFDIINLVLNFFQKNSSLRFPMFYSLFFLVFELVFAAYFYTDFPLLIYIVFVMVVILLTFLRFDVLINDFQNFGLLYFKPPFGFPIAKLTSQNTGFEYVGHFYLILFVLLTIIMYIGISPYGFSTRLDPFRFFIVVISPFLMCLFFIGHSLDVLNITTTLLDKNIHKTAEILAEQELPIKVHFQAIDTFVGDDILFSSTSTIVTSSSSPSLSSFEEVVLHDNESRSRSPSLLFDSSGQENGEYPISSFQELNQMQRKRNSIVECSLNIDSTFDRSNIVEVERILNTGTFSRNNSTNDLFTYDSMGINDSNIESFEKIKKLSFFDDSKSSKSSKSLKVSFNNDNALEPSEPLQLNSDESLKTKGNYKSSSNDPNKNDSSISSCIVPNEFEFCDEELNDDKDLNVSKNSKSKHKQERSSNEFKCHNIVQYIKRTGKSLRKLKRKLLKRLVFVKETKEYSDDRHEMVDHSQLSTVEQIEEFINEIDLNLYRLKIDRGLAYIKLFAHECHYNRYLYKMLNSMLRQNEEHLFNIYRNLDSDRQILFLLWFISDNFNDIIRKMYSVYIQHLIQIKNESNIHLNDVFEKRQRERSNSIRNALHLEDFKDILLHNSSSDFDLETNNDDKDLPVNSDDDTDSNSNCNSIDEQNSKQQVDLEGPEDTRSSHSKEKQREDTAEAEYIKSLGNEKLNFAKGIHRQMSTSQGFLSNSSRNSATKSSSTGKNSSSRTKSKSKYSARNPGSKRFVDRRLSNLDSDSLTHNTLVHHSVTTQEIHSCDPSNDPSNDLAHDPGFIPSSDFTSVGHSSNEPSSRPCSQRTSNDSNKIVFGNGKNMMLPKHLQNMHDCDINTTIQEISLSKSLTDSLMLDLSAATILKTQTPISNIEIVDYEDEIDEVGQRKDESVQTPIVVATNVHLSSQEEVENKIEKENEMSQEILKSDEKENVKFDSNEDVPKEIEVEDNNNDCNSSIVRDNTELISNKDKENMSLLEDLDLNSNITSITNVPVSEQEEANVIISKEKEKAENIVNEDSTDNKWIGESSIQHCSHQHIESENNSHQISLVLSGNLNVSMVGKVAKPKFYDNQMLYGVMDNVHVSRSQSILEYQPSYPIEEELYSNAHPSSSLKKSRFIIDRNQNEMNFDNINDLQNEAFEFCELIIDYISSYDVKKSISSELLSLIANCISLCDFLSVNENNYFSDDEKARFEFHNSLQALGSYLKMLSIQYNALLNSKKDVRKKYSRRKKLALKQFYQLAGKLRIDNKKFAMKEFQYKSFQRMNLDSLFAQIRLNTLKIPSNSWKFFESVAYIFSLSGNLDILPNLIDSYDISGIVLVRLYVVGIPIYVFVDDIQPEKFETSVLEDWPCMCVLPNNYSSSLFPLLAKALVAQTNSTNPNLTVTECLDYFGTVTNSFQTSLIQFNIPKQELFWKYLDRCIFDDLIVFYCESNDVTCVIKSTLTIMNKTSHRFVFVVPADNVSTFDNELDNQNHLIGDNTTASGVISNCIWKYPRGGWIPFQTFLHNVSFINTSVWIKNTHQSYILLKDNNEDTMLGLQFSSSSEKEKIFFTLSSADPEIGVSNIELRIGRGGLNYSVVHPYNFCPDDELSKKNNQYVCYYCNRIHEDYYLRVSPLKEPARLDVYCSITKVKISVLEKI
eukprot:TRINITY_DN1917_c0_g1_i1.p1 TRINITY_DN1917_c0_g1~~TRINITY_DN1917_c0_g1_i1.p1  ORF type:complete len:2226 (+),score=408.95 TRINITY_DN1917_c0_g1_i1:58-6735(+)